MSGLVRDQSANRVLVHTSDLDQLVEQVTMLMSSHTVAPARAGGFTADVSGVQTPGLSLLHMDYGMPLRLTAGPVNDYVAVCLPLTGSMTARHQGCRIEVVAGQSALVRTPESELVMDWDETLKLLVLRIDLSALRSFANRLVTTTAERPDLRFAPAMEGPQITATAVGQARMLQELLAGAGREQVNPLVAAHLREQVMFTLLLGQPNTWSPALRARPPRVRRSVVGEAVELIRAHAGEPLTIEGLAVTVGLSVRALHAGFRRELDRSPKQYLQQVRLQRAHDDLTAATPGAGINVIDVAHRWGFSNQGRFATAYRDHYGLAPSDTLACPPRT